MLTTSAGRCRTAAAAAAAGLPLQLHCRLLATLAAEPAMGQEGLVGGPAQKYVAKKIHRSRETSQLTCCGAIACAISC